MTLNTRAPSPNRDEHESVSTYRHAVCEDCGRAIHAHDRTRVPLEDGPSRAWHYVYECPGGDGS